MRSYYEFQLSEYLLCNNVTVKSRYNTVSLYFKCQDISTIVSLKLQETCGAVQAVPEPKPAKPIVNQSRVGSRLGRCFKMRLPLLFC